MRFRQTAVLLLAWCLPVWVEAQTAPPAPEQPENPSDAAPKPWPAPKDYPELRSARDAVRRAGGGSGGYQPAPQAPQTGDDFRQWITSRQPTEKGAWIGISTSPASPVLRRQLKLPEGTGLVVDFVQPKSPADEAGIKQYDLLQRLNEQLLINSEQFAVLVRTFKPGEEVKLALFREGKQQTLGVKLAEHELQKLNELNPLQGFTAPQPIPSVPGPHPMWGSGDLFGSDRPESSLTWLDGKLVVMITAKDGHSTLSTLEHPGGKVIDSWPIDTDEQRSALPKAIRERLARLKFPAGSKYDGLRSDSSDAKDPTAPVDPPAPPAAR